MLNRYKNLIFLTIVLVVYSCTKNEGDYEFHNKTTAYSGNVYEYLQSQKGVFDSMMLAIDLVPGLADSLKDESKNYTVFAATNNSFELALGNLNQVRKLAGKPSLSLSTVDPLQLDSLICRYLVKGIYTSDTLKNFMDGLVVPSIKKDTSGTKDYVMHLQLERLSASGLKDGGPKYIMFSDAKMSIFKRFWVSSPTAAVDRFAKNGIIHVLSSGHDFGFGEFIKRTDK